MHVIRSRSKNRENLYVGFSYRNESGKNTTKTVAKLCCVEDKMAEENMTREMVYEWAKEQVTQYTKAKESTKVHIILDEAKCIPMDTQNSFNVGYLFLQKILSELQIPKIARRLKDRTRIKYDLSAILCDFIYGRILEPSSKRKNYDFAKTLLEPPTYSLKDEYRALKLLGDNHLEIQSFLYKKSQDVCKRDTGVLYYDCTNFYFEMETEGNIQKYRVSKEHRPNPIVTMGLFMDAKGIPLAFDIYEGNKNEQLTLKPLEKKVISDFGCSEFIYCSDSGLGSKTNRKFQINTNQKYVITQSVKKMSNDNIKLILNPTTFKDPETNEFIDISKLDEDDKDIVEKIYYKELPFTFSKKGEKSEYSENLVITYSVKYKRYQQKIRENQINRAKELINRDGFSLSKPKNPNDARRFIKSEKEQKEHYVINDEQIEKEKRFDGFYAVVTNLEKPASDIIAINRQRWEIEECFRIMKTDLKGRPVFVTTDEAIRGHFLTCFISLMVLRILEQKLNYCVPMGQLVETLRKMNVTSIANSGYVPSYKRTHLTDSLHDLVDFRTDTEFISKSIMRNYVKLSKDDKITHLNTVK